jgi:transcriptional regulator with XRE-family HTH domain
VVRHKPEQVISDVGRRFAEIRLRRGWTQKEFAENIGISLKYLQKVESGKANLSLASLARLATRYSVPVAELFKRPRSRIVRRGRPPGT